MCRKPPPCQSGSRHPNAKNAQTAKRPQKNNKEAMMEENLRFFLGDCSLFDNLNSKYWIAK